MFEPLTTYRFDSLERRMEVLAREIAAGPKLKPGFFVEDGKLGYAHPPILIGIDPATTSSEDKASVAYVWGDGSIESKEDPFTCELKIGDRVRGLLHGIPFEGVVEYFTSTRGWFHICCQGARTYALRGSLEFLRRGEATTAPAKTFDPMTEPLQVGDLVEAVIEGYGDLDGKQGRVVRTDKGYVYVLPEKSGQPMCFAMRESLKLIEKAKKIPK
jgi:hypothetical protein